MGKLPCCIVDDVRKGSWTAEEDQKLIAYVQKHGEGGWRSLPVKAGEWVKCCFTSFWKTWISWSWVDLYCKCSSNLDLQRCGKSCRLRWTNYLRPGIKRGSFTPQEEEMIIKLHAQLGNRWAAIARQLPERTDNEIKNYWNAHIKKRLLENGIDPVTHKPAVLGCDGQDSPSEADQPAEQPPLSKRKCTSAKEVLNKLAARFTTLQSLDSIKSWIRFGLLRPPSDSDGSDGDHTADIMDYLYHSDSASDGQEHSSLPENSSITASGQPLNQMADTLLAWVADDVSPPQQSVAPVNDDGVSDGNRDVGSTWFWDFEFIEDLLALPGVEEEVGRSCQIVPVRGSD